MVWKCTKCLLLSVLGTQVVLLWLVFAAEELTNCFYCMRSKATSYLSMVWTMAFQLGLPIASEFNFHHLSAYWSQLSSLKLAIFKGWTLVPPLSLQLSLFLCTHFRKILVFAETSPDCPVPIYLPKYDWMLFKLVGILYLGPSPLRRDESLHLARASHR